MRVARSAFVPVVAVILMFSVSAGSQRPTELDQLKKQVAALADQVRALEGHVKALEAILGGSIAGVGGTARGSAAPAAAPVAAPPAGSAVAANTASTASSDQFEAEAQAAIMEIPKLADQGKAVEAREKIAEFRSKYGSSKIAGQATYFSHELDIVGKDVPKDWGLEKWFQGEKAIDLSGKKPTLIVFWEEWCPHCREEMPKLEQLYAAQKARGIQIIGVTKVTQSSTDEKVQAYLSANGIEFPIAKESGVLSTYFDVSGIPAAVMTKSGKVIWRGHPIRITPEVINNLANLAL